MTWTDIRVERLKKLTTDGFTASQIANDLGGITRNAVIGKQHRIGLSTPSKRKGVPHPDNIVRRRRSRTVGLRVPTGGTLEKCKLPRAKTASPQALEQAQIDFQAAAEATDLPPDASDRAVTFMQLTAETCRWPMGTPCTPEFRFCGDTPWKGAPYCGRHCNIAYRAPEARRS